MSTFNAVGVSNYIDVPLNTLPLLLLLRTIALLQLQHESLHNERYHHLQNDLYTKDQHQCLGQ